MTRLDLYNFQSRIVCVISSHFFLGVPQAFNWLLCNVIQTTSLHDILWHFVASLTPSPFEPEDEEDDENKGNKEVVEQVVNG